MKIRSSAAKLVLRLLTEKNLLRRPYLFSISITGGFALFFYCFNDAFEQLKLFFSRHPVYGYIQVENIK